MFARHVIIKGDPQKIDDVLRAQRDVMLPALHGSTGFRAQLVLLDQSAGHVVGISIWETEELMTASEKHIRAARQQVAAAMGASEPPEVRLYEVAIFDQA